MAYLFENLWIITKANWTRTLLPFRSESARMIFNATTDGNRRPLAQAQQTISKQWSKVWITTNTMMMTTTTTTMMMITHSRCHSIFFCCPCTIQPHTSPLFSGGCFRRCHCNYCQFHGLSQSLAFTTNCPCINNILSWVNSLLRKRKHRMYLCRVRNDAVRW